MNIKFILGFLISVALYSQAMCMEINFSPEQKQALLDSERSRMQQEDNRRTEDMWKKAKEFKENTDLPKKHTRKKNRK